MLTTEQREILTPAQIEALELVEQHGGYRSAAKATGRNQRGLERAVKRARLALAKRGLSPEHGLVHEVPPGYKLKGSSTLYHAERGQLLQWVKTSEDQERLEQLRQEAREAFASEIPRATPAKPPKQVGDEDLLNCYIVTDYHLGMRCWPEETTGDWDTEHAEELLYRWFEAAIEASPNARDALLIQLGDWLHFDGLDAVTPASGHLLDADTRFQKLVRITIRAFRRVIAMLLARHDRVHIIMAEGNHDLSASAWMRELFAAHYENEPRVCVDTSPDIYYCHEFGQNSIFAHHGHKRPPAKIDDVFAAKFRPVFGRTRHSHAHLGHLHHERTVESNLMLVEQHRTLAAPDSYASRGGWISGRSAKVITYHREYGKVGEVQISPEMV